MNDVFISYSRRNKEFTRKLYEALIAAERTVWADWDSIPAASDWLAEIKQGIEQTNTVLFVLSPEWIKSSECRKELTHAVAMGKRLLPILYEMVDPNEVPPELSKINWVYMRDTDNFESAFQTLLAAMDTDLDWIKTHTRIQIRAVEWDKKNRDHSFVLRGKDLSDGEQFIAGATGKTPEVTPLQGDYILVSRKDATRRQRITLAGVVIALIVSVALGIAAFFQRQAAVVAQEQAELAQARAEEEQAKAEAAQLIAEAEARATNSGRLSLEAENSIKEYPQRALLLALEAVKVNQDANEPVRPDAEEALRLALDKVTGMGLTGFNHQVNLIEFSDDNRWLIAGTNTIEGEIKIWNVEKATNDPTYQPFYVSFPVAVNDGEVYDFGEYWLPKIYLSPQAHWLVAADVNETKLWQIDDEDEIREPIIFDGVIEFANVEDDHFILENQENQVIYWQIDTATLTKKELDTFEGSFVSLSDDLKYLVTDDSQRGLLLWNFSKPSTEPIVLTEKHLSDFTYQAISPNNEWMILFENRPLPQYQIPTFDDFGNVNGTEPWNATSILLIPLSQNNKQTYTIDLDFNIDVDYRKPKFSPDGKSFAYLGLLAPNEIGSASGMAIGVIRFSGIEYINLTAPTKTESFNYFSFINNDWLYAETSDYQTYNSTTKFFDLRENDLFANGETSLLLVVDVEGDVTLSEDGNYLPTYSGEVINFHQLDFNQFISVESAPQNSEIQLSGLELEINNNPRDVGLENFANAITQSADGKWFAAGGFDGSVRIWNNIDPYIDSSIQLPINPNYIAFSNDNQWMAINGTLWQLENGKPKQAYPFETRLTDYGSHYVWLGVFSPDSRSFIYINTADPIEFTFNINLIDLSAVTNTEQIQSTEISKGNALYTSIQFSQNGDWVLIGDDKASSFAAGADSENIQSFAYDIENKTHYSLPTQATSFVFTPDQNHIAMPIAIKDAEQYTFTWQAVEVWSLPTQSKTALEKISGIEIQGTPIISPNGHWILIVPNDATTTSKLTDTNCIIEQTECQSYELQATRAGFSPNSQYLVTGFNNSPESETTNTYEIWNLQNIEQTNQLEKIHSAESAASFPIISKDGNLVLFVKLPVSFSTFSGISTAGAFTTWSGYNNLGFNVTSYDGYGHIFIGGGGGGGNAFGGYQADYIVESITIANHTKILLRGHESNISDSHISPNEKIVITYSGFWQEDGGDPEKLLRLWDMDKLRLNPTEKPIVLPLELDSSGRINILAFNPTGEWVYVVDDKNVLHYYPISIEVLKERACIALGRNLTFSEWERFFPNTAYRKTCENLPEHPSAIR